MLMLADYAGLSPKQPVNTFASGVNLNMYSRGMGAMGLPGGFIIPFKICKSSLYEDEFTFR